MDFLGWSDGLALLPRDYLAEGEPLVAVVQAAGPYSGEALHLLALGTAATMARLHLGGIAGLRLNPGNVMIGPEGRAFFAPGPRSSEFPSADVRDWADVIVFAATGRPVRDGERPYLGPVPELRVVIEECRRPNALSRPAAIDVVRALLGDPWEDRRATVRELLLEAERWTVPKARPSPSMADGRSGGS
ncbi:hypothetical protein FE391_41440 [Nonomuraea sp. KC401]|uniref:hypothetical protein n=1 Tax=unclassified Nonomuraea TaxID=2593643 RepID=UPI0010FEF06C|nr:MULTISPECIES: hypothetical protein [unclassified Nonomuraea]NBE99965.1 hypothetical protein [Nonomuraea sp. K271]TLF54789.1 hypothetical protein FE391_41440 [Nonomuraea sp. KC401]